MMCGKQIFREVSCFGTKSGTCPKCGGKARRSQKFWQTLNAFNTNKKGGVKTRDEIMKELMKERAGWLTAPVYHARCED